MAQVEGSVGAVSRYLGLLAKTIGRLDDAELHLSDAVALNERMGAKPWAAHSRFDLADVLLERDAPGDRERATEALRTARATCQELGMPALAEKVANRLADLGAGRVHVPEPPGPTGPATFRREGEYWTVVFGGDAFRLRDTKGLQYLARLLAEPGREFHVLDLVGSRPESGGDAGALLDPQAKAAYRRRLDELEEEIQDAESTGDARRIEHARSEREFIARELGTALGLGGRDRVAASASERARVNVTRAVKATLGRIAEHSSTLGRHLEATVRTGTYCSYEPDPRVPVPWEI